ncbi:MAG TPA: 30S ribosome-binding factor RbfA [Thermoleophilia bacterium]|nr:30S ribosome-binding factor RbfA [Thermoleophilia bacterium]
MGHRLLRINESIKETLSSVITAEGLKDPRVGFVTVTGVETTPDLRHAKVFVSVLGGKTERDATLKALEKSRGVLQAKINATLHMKRTPQLQFLYDETLDNALRIERAMKREAAVLGEEPHEIPVPGAEPAELVVEGLIVDDDVDDPAGDDERWDGDAGDGAADGGEDEA